MFIMKISAKTADSNIILPERSNKEYDTDINDERSVIIDICECFQETGQLEFEVSGFGQERWPVDCAFDLAVIMEQIPEVFPEAQSDDFNFTLEFYEQGIEREVIFETKEGIVEVHCVSRTQWQPNPESIFLSKEYVRNLFVELVNQFKHYGNLLCPDLMNQSLLRPLTDI